jgi:integrase
MGQDPAKDRRKKRTTRTVAELAQSFLADEAGRLKPGTLVNYELYFRRYVIPHMGTMKVDGVSHADIARLHRNIGRTKPTTANRVVEALGSFYCYAEGEGEVARGYRPAAGIKAFREQGRERFLVYEELGRLGAAIEEAERDGIPWRIDEGRPGSKHTPKGERRTRIDPFAAAAIRLLIFTGARLGEILTLRWDYVAAERSLLFLPDSKTGRKTIVLNAPAMAILCELPRVGPYVVPGADPKRPRTDLKKPWGAIIKRAGLEGLRLHDLRHSFASIGAGGGMGLPIVGKLLGHSSPATTARYAHLDADPLRRASNSIGATIAAAMGRRPAAEVVPIASADRSAR